MHTKNLGDPQSNRIMNTSKRIKKILVIVASVVLIVIGLVTFFVIKGSNTSQNNYSSSANSSSNQTTTNSNGNVFEFRDSKRVGEKMDIPGYVPIYKYNYGDLSKKKIDRYSQDQAMLEEEYYKFNWYVSPIPCKGDDGKTYACFFVKTSEASDGVEGDFYARDNPGYFTSIKPHSKAKLIPDNLVQSVYEEANSYLKLKNN